MTEFFKTEKPEFDHLMGRQFIHGVHDCYQLAKDFYEHNTVLQLGDYARPDDWWLGDEDLYLKNFESEGFVCLPDINLRDIQPYDAFLIAIPDGRRPEKAVTNHCAIYVGDGKIIHHRLGKLSQWQVFRGMLKDYTTHVVRHKDIPKLKSTTGNIDILDYMLPHKRDQLLKAIEDAG